MPDALTPTRWITWGRSLFALIVVGMLLALGVANIALRAQLHQVEDGVLWSDRAEGVTAVEVAAGSPAATAGIERGDVILAINGTPVERRDEVETYQRNGTEGTRLAYTLARLGTRPAGVEPGQFMSPHGLAVDSRGDIYIGEVSFTNWRNRYKDQAPPAGLRSLQKLVKVR